MNDDKGMYIPTPQEMETEGGDHFAFSQIRGFWPETVAWNIFDMDENEDNKK